MDSDCSSLSNAPSFETDIDTGITTAIHQDVLSPFPSPVASEVDDQAIVPLNNGKISTTPPTIKYHDPDFEDQSNVPIADLLSEHIMDSTDSSDEGSSDEVEETPIEVVVKGIRQEAFVSAFPLTFKVSEQIILPVKSGSISMAPPTIGPPHNLENQYNVPIADLLSEYIMDSCDYSSDEGSLDEVHETPIEVAVKENHEEAAISAGLDIDTEIPTQQDEISPISHPVATEVGEPIIVPLKSVRIHTALPTIGPHNIEDQSNVPIADLLSECIIDSTDGSLDAESSEEVEEKLIEVAMKEIRQEAVVPAERRKSPVVYEIDGESVVLETDATQNEDKSSHRQKGFEDLNQLLSDHLLSVETPQSSDVSDDEFKEKILPSRPVSARDQATDEVDAPSTMDPCHTSTDDSSDEERDRMIAAMRNQIKLEAVMIQDDSSSSDESLTGDLFQPSDKHRGILQHMMNCSFSLYSTVSGELQPTEELRKEEDEKCDSSADSFDLTTEREVCKGQPQPTEDGSEAPEIPEDEVMEERYEEESLEGDKIQPTLSENEPKMLIEMNDMDGKPKEKFICVEITMEHNTVSAAALENSRRCSFESSVTEVVKDKDESLISEVELSKSLKSEELREAITDAIVNQIKKPHSGDRKGSLVDEPDKAEVIQGSRFGDFIRSKIMKKELKKSSDIESNKVQELEEQKGKLERQLQASNEVNEAQAKKITKLESVVKRLHDHIEELERLIGHFNTVERTRSLNLADIGTMTDQLELTDEQTQHKVVTQSVHSQKYDAKLDIRHVRCQSASLAEPLIAVPESRNVLCQIKPAQITTRNITCQASIVSQDQDVERRDVHCQINQARASTRNVRCQAALLATVQEKRNVLSQVDQQNPTTRNVLCQYSDQTPALVAPSTRDVVCQVDQVKPSVRHVRCQCSDPSDGSNNTSDPTTSVDRILEQSNQDGGTAGHDHHGFDLVAASLDPEGPDRWRRLAGTQFSSDPSVLILQKSLSSALLENDTLDQKLSKMQRNNGCKKMEIERRIMELQDEIEKAIRGNEEQPEKSDNAVEDISKRIHDLEKCLCLSKWQNEEARTQFTKMENEMKSKASEAERKLKDLQVARDKLTNEWESSEKKNERLQRNRAAEY
ncbi:hypothetical protein CAPTEDRAFT_185619 [Capitella teleta]|uniref:Uncharacterized protein n=1 Tax=Capitella teleta TaxID=283909 RepID=R7VHH7_CAPTE|nr:hypothetical protein CAPTEDRAFT_185619 [Capitella teleta]|eukprot:ELU15145.1 hypothetical protein CAPTEDRAFT_185619 [Capitella teleta]